MSLQKDETILQLIQGFTEAQSLKFFIENYGCSRNQAVHMLGAVRGDLPVSDVGDLSAFILSEKPAAPKRKTDSVAKKRVRKGKVTASNQTVILVNPSQANPSQGRPIITVSNQSGAVMNLGKERAAKKLA